MASVLFVRITSDLEPSELDRRLLERRPRFLEVPGLPEGLRPRSRDGDVCGIYFFETSEALAAFRETELARTIRMRTKPPTSAARSTRCCIRCGPSADRLVGAAADATSG